MWFLTDFLYGGGVVARLGMGAYLLDLGAADDWCRQRIGLLVDKALAIANEAGLYHRDPAMLELAGLLSPYGQWRGPFAADLPAIATINTPRVSATLDGLLGTVRRRLAGVSNEGAELSNGIIVCRTPIGYGLERKANSNMT